MRPSCGLRRSAMSSFASTFRRVVTPGASRFGIRCISCSTPSIAEADDQRVLLRLEMDVAGAVLGGLEDDRVDEPDERRVRDAVVVLEVVDSCVARRPRSSSRSIELRRSPRRATRLEALELREDVVARGDAERELVARREPQLVDRVDVRRVGDRDVRRLAVEPVRQRDRRAGARGAGSARSPRARRRSSAGRRTAGGGARRACGRRRRSRRGPPRRAPRRTSVPWRARPRTARAGRPGTSPVASIRSATSSARRVAVPRAADRPPDVAGGLRPEPVGYGVWPLRVRRASIEVSASAPRALDSAEDGSR